MAAYVTHRGQQWMKKESAEEPISLIKAIATRSYSMFSETPVSFIDTT